jgi:hypothetical protein
LTWPAGPEHLCPEQIQYVRTIKMEEVIGAAVETGQMVGTVWMKELVDTL